MTQDVAEGKGRGFSLNYEDHKGLLHSFARKMYGRLVSAHVATTYEDVYGELCVAYSAALKDYDPNRGIAFTTFFGTCCFHRFNKLADKLIREQVELKLVRLEDMEKRQADRSGDDADFLDWFDETDQDGFDIDHQKAMPPDEILERKQEFWEKLNKLSPNARAYVSELMGHPSKDTENFDQEERRAIRIELMEVYGVTPNQLKV